MNKAIKYSILGFVALLVLLLIAIPFIPADTYRAPIEEQLSEALQLDVSIGDVTLTSLPSPGIKAQRIHISKNGREIALLDSIRITPRLATVFSEQIRIRNVHLNGLIISTDDITHFTRTDSPEKPAKARVHIAGISGNDNRIRIGNEQVFGPFTFNIELGKSHDLQALAVTLEQQNFEFNLDHAGPGYHIELHASDWTPPTDPAITLDSLQIHGEHNKDRLLLKTIKATLYEGQLEGNLLLTQGTPVKLDSRINLTTLNMGMLLKAMNNHTMDGAVSAQTTLRSESDNLAGLADKYRVESNILIENGHLYETDLEQAARSLSAEWQTGGQTPFDSIKARAIFVPDLVTVKDLNITSNLLAATGDMKIRKNTELNGKISVGLNEPTGMITMPLMVAGTTDAPKIRPTDEAIAGGTIGTAILGPGIGTAVGVKAGEFVGKIGELFGSDDDEKEPEKKP